MNPADLNPDKLVAEARAAFATSDSPIRTLVFLRGLLLKLEDVVFDEYRRGARPLSAELVDGLFADLRAAIAAHPSVPTACLALDRAVAELEREIAGSRGLLPEIDRRVADDKKVIRPPGAAPAIGEREAIRGALGLPA